VCSGQGRRVETADSIATALKIAVRRPVCVMIADAAVQVVGDGVGLAKAVHMQNPNVKCFLIADKNSSDVSNSTVNEPWLRFVHKPIPMLRFSADLVEVINESCG
jgi:DNA-binding NtrC family response regulator